MAQRPEASHEGGPKSTVLRRVKMAKALPCLYCFRLLTGYSIINIKRLKKHKSIKCPHCGTFNVVTSSDYSRVIDTGRVVRTHRVSEYPDEQEQHLLGDMLS